MWAKEKRVAPAEKTQWPDLQLQRRAGNKLDQINWQRESVDTGAGVAGRMLSKFTHTGVMRLCNISNPARKHLTWQCESLAAKRCALFSARDLPDANTAAEGLLILSRNIAWEFKPCRLLRAGLQLLRPPVQHDLSMIIENAFQQPQGNLCVVATDGGSVRCNLNTKGSWGIANCTQAIGGELQGLTKARTLLKSTPCLSCFLLLKKKSQIVP